MKHESPPTHTNSTRPSLVVFLPAVIEFLVYGFLVREMWMLWSQPTPADFPRLQTLALLMGFEFILVHSALFFTVMPRKVSILFLLPVYGALAYVLNTGAEHNLILYLYLGLIVTRLRFLFTKHSPAEKSRAFRISIVAGLIYFASIAIIAVGEASLPRGGLTPEFLETHGYIETLHVGGIFTEQPHLPLLMGMIYFSLMMAFGIVLIVRQMMRGHRAG